MKLGELIASFEPNEIIIFSAVFLLAMVVLSALIPRGRSRSSGRRYRNRRWRGADGKVLPFRRGRSGPDDAWAFDSAEQLRIVMEAPFKKRPVLSKKEAEVFALAERAIGEAGLPWRVMAQVSIGEFLSSPDEEAYRAVNSKRVDILIVSERREALAAIEYQGQGHYQGTAPARDAVKKEALRKAGVRYIEVTHEHEPEDVARETARLAKVEGMKAGR